MDWKDNQLLAITEKNKDLLVSAAAGSGKTAVLIERIIRLILQDGADIDRFLVVTFTKAAASEMKEKLVKAIRQQIRVEEDPEKRAFLRRQESRLYLANISTFHSFAISVVRRFFQYVDVDPSVRVIDEGEADILRADAMEEVFYDLFLQKDAAFLRFLDRHSRNGGEESLKKSLLQDYDKLRSIPHYFAWLRESIGRLSLPLAEAYAGEPLARLRADYISELEKADAAYQELQALLLDHGVPTIWEQVADQAEAAAKMLAACRTADDFRSCIADLPKASLAQKNLSDDEKAAYQGIKETASKLQKRAQKYVTELQKTYLRHTDAEEEAMMRQTAEDGAVYLAILEEFEKRYVAEKNDRRVLDFSDIEHYAIEILSRNDAAAIYREQFDYIFIDEYQDSNYLQEAIIGAIAKENSLFMVGDVKQSIYHFRMAEPDIFLEKYRLYGTPEEAGMKIDLNHNFRSKAGVIEGVNYLFARLMEGYDENAALRQGAPDEQDIVYPVDCCLLDRTLLPAAGEDEVDEELAQMKWQEKEAYMLVKLIREWLGKPFYDTKEGIVRTFRLQDMVILMRSVKTAGPVFKDVFQKEGIALYVAETSSFFETIEIRTFLDLLRLLDNPQRDIALLGVLRSFFFDFSIDELINIRMHDKTVPFHQAFADYGENGAEESLRKKCSEADKTLEQYRRLATYLPLDELIGRLLHDTGYYACMGAVPGGEQRQANLRTLADKTQQLMDMGRTRIQDLLRYVESLQKRGNVDVGQTSLLGENDDVVRLMTIHKSKGLEYPLVFVSGLGAGANNKSASGFAVFDRTMGLALPFVDEKKRYKESLLLKTLIREKQKQQEEEEDIRVLYVALTRARDKLILTGTVDPVKPEKSYYYGKLAEMLHQPDCPINVREMDPLTLLPSGSPVTARYPSVNDLLSDYLKHRDETVRDAVTSRLSARYPYEEDLTAKSKYSVTELNHQEEETCPVIRLPGFLAAEEEQGEKEHSSRAVHGAALGTVLHTAMEHLPLAGMLKTAEEKGEEALRTEIHAYLDALAEAEILTSRERLAVDEQMIVTFLTGTIGDRLRQADAVYRETPFTCTLQRDGQEVLVQGIIDCWFVEDGQLVLLDYKSNLHTEDIRSLYQSQIDLYRDALERLTEMPVKESYLYLLREGRLVAMQ